MLSKGTNECNLPRWFPSAGGSLRTWMWYLQSRANQLWTLPTQHATCRLEAIASPCFTSWNSHGWPKKLGLEEHKNILSFWIVASMSVLFHYFGHGSTWLGHPLHGATWGSNTCLALNLHQWVHIFWEPCHHTPPSSYVFLAPGARSPFWNL